MTVITVITFLSLLLYVTVRQSVANISQTKLIFPTFQSKSVPDKIIQGVSRRIVHYYRVSSKYLSVFLQ